MNFIYNNRRYALPFAILLISCLIVSSAFADPFVVTVGEDHTFQTCNIQNASAFCHDPQTNGEEGASAVGNYAEAYVTNGGCDGAGAFVGVSFTIMGNGPCYATISVDITSYYAQVSSDGHASCTVCWTKSGQHSFGIPCVYLADVRGGDGEEIGSSICTAFIRLEPGQTYWVYAIVGADAARMGYFGDSYSRIVVGEVRIEWDSLSPPPPEPEPRPPVASFRYIPEKPMVGGNIEFDASDSYDPDGTIVSYEWDFGDANSAYTASPYTNHNYKRPGDYTVTLTVTDNDLLPDTATSNVKVKSKEFMITFDDGPIPGQTDSILLQLMNCKVDGEPVKAAFFMVGDADWSYCFFWDREPKGSVKKNPDLVKAVKDLEHFVGNHTQHHAWFPRYKQFHFNSMEDFVKNEISQCNSTIEEVLGISPPKIFRAPYLQEEDYPSAVYGAAKQLDFTVVGGQIVDSTFPSVERAIGNARDILEAWDEDEPVVLIFHDNRSVTYDHIGEIIKALQDEGYSLAHFDVTRIPKQTQRGAGRDKQVLSGIAHCPVDLLVTDPDGLVLGKEQNQIPDAIYEEIDVDEDGDLDDFFVIPDAKPGQYLIQVIPEPNALPEDTYSLEVSHGEEIIVLAEHVQVKEIPAEPYLVVIERPPEPNEEGKINITEQFIGGVSDIFDLSYKAIMFSPVGDGRFYNASLRNIDQLPTDPIGGLAISLSDDDYEYIRLSGQRTVSICGSSFAGFYVGSNGYITFSEGNSESSESLSNHFDTLRVSCLFNDFDPSSSGTVSIKQLTDRVVVTWKQIPQYGTGGSSTFQVEMYFDGRIQLAWLEVSVLDGVVGLSDGQGLSSSFEETDLSELSSTSYADLVIGNFEQSMEGWGPTWETPAGNTNDQKFSNFNFGTAFAL